MEIPVKINMHAPILALDGQAVLDGDRPVTLRTIVQGALLASLPEDSALSGDEKARMFRLALEANEPLVDWKVEDVALVKARVGVASTPLAVGRAYEQLDGGSIL